MVLQRENVLSSREYSAGAEQHPWSSLGALIRLMPRPWPTPPIFVSFGLSRYPLGFRIAASDALNRAGFAGGSNC